MFGNSESGSELQFVERTNDFEPTHQETPRTDGVLVMGIYVPVHIVAEGLESFPDLHLRVIEGAVFFLHALHKFKCLI